MRSPCRPSQPKAGCWPRLHTLTGDFGSALEEGLEAKRFGEALLAVKRTPKTRRDTAVNSLFLCQTRRGMGDLFQASACIGKTFEQLSAIAAEDPGNAQAKWDLAVAYSERGEIFAARGMPVQALASFREALRLNKEQGAKDPFSHNGFRAIGTSLTRVGAILATSPSDRAEAAAIFEEAIVVCSRAQTLASSDVYIMASLARAYRGKAALAAREADPIDAMRALQQSVYLWRQVIKLCPLDVDLKVSAEEAERALARLNK